MKPSDDCTECSQQQEFNNDWCVGCDLGCVGCEHEKTNEGCDACPRGQCKEGYK